MTRYDDIDGRSLAEQREIQERFNGLYVSLVIDDADVLEAPIMPRHTGDYLVRLGWLTLQASNETNLARVLRLLADRLDAAAVEP